VLPISEPGRNSLASSRFLVVSGYGGIKHCLIPSPRHIVIKRNENGQYEDYLFKDEQNAEVMLDILGYND